MPKQKNTDVTKQRTYSRAFLSGIEILVEEIALAWQWKRPSILYAIHISQTGLAKAQLALEKEIIKREGEVVHITVEHDGPDVIGAIVEKRKFEKVVFFVSGIENTNQATEGYIYNALNIRREYLVEKRICAVFWMNKSGTAHMPKLAPDFWAFRHRVVEFASKRGVKSQFLPTGLFIWEEEIPCVERSACKKTISYYEKLMTKLPPGQESISMRLQILLKLAHYTWLVNAPKKLSGYLRDGFDLLERYPIPYFQAWMHNAKGILLYEEGKMVDANVQFEKAMAYAPENMGIKMNASLALHGLGKNTTAILNGRQAISKDPENFMLWRVLGHMFLHMGRSGEAIDCMKKAGSLNLQNVDIHYSLAVCFHQNGQTAESQKELLKVKTLSSYENIIQLACAEALGGKIMEAAASLQSSLETGILDETQIWRDPNLSLLLNMHNFMEPT